MDERIGHYATTAAISAGAATPTLLASMFAPWLAATVAAVTIGALVAVWRCEKRRRLANEHAVAALMVFFRVCDSIALAMLASPKNGALVQGDEHDPLTWAANPVIPMEEKDEWM